MTLFESLEALIPKGDCIHLAYVGEIQLTKDFLQSYVHKAGNEFYDLKRLPLRRWSFGGEFFKVMLIEDATLLSQTSSLKIIKKALQKNRYLVLFGEYFSMKEIELALEPLGFSNFSQISYFDEGKEAFIFSAKKWFVL